MSKRFRIAKRISMKDIDHFEDIEVDDDFVDKDMVQIIADNEYDPMYDDCESIAVALQLAGYGKVADLEAKLAESEKRMQAYEEIVEQKDKEISFANRDKTCIVKQLNDPKAYVLLEDYKKLKQQLAEWQDGTIICKWTDAENKVKELEHQLAEKEELIMFADRTIKGLVLAKEIDKISFCIEQLEKVKEFCDNPKYQVDYEYYTNCWTYAIDKDSLLNEIDNQIKAIKEMK